MDVVKELVKRGAKVNTHMKVRILFIFELFLRQFKVKLLFGITFHSTLYIQYIQFLEFPAIFSG